MFVVSSFRVDSGELEPLGNRKKTNNLDPKKQNETKKNGYYSLTDCVLM